MNKKTKKKIYLLSLSTLLLTVCNKNISIKEELPESYINKEIDDLKQSESEDFIKEEEISEIETIEKPNEIEIVDNDIIEEVSENEINSSELEDLETNNEISIILPESNFNNEEELVKYFVKLKEDVEILLTLDSKENESKIDTRVMTFVNFMVENVEIGGFYFEDLTEDSKEYIKALYIDMDTKIDASKPNYKEKLIEKSKVFKNYIVNSYNIIKEQVKKWHEEGTLKENLYEGIFGRLDDDLENAKETGKDILDKIKQKIKK